MIDYLKSLENWASEPYQLIKSVKGNLEITARKQLLTTVYHKYWFIAHLQKHGPVAATIRNSSNVKTLLCQAL